MKPLRDKLSYANVMSTVAVFVALGGSSYAALTISGKNVKNGSLTGKDIKPNSLASRQIKERKLGTVPRAANAAKVGGMTADRLLITCPPGTLPVAAACVETQARPVASYGGATTQCSGTDNAPAARVVGRRLPTYDELRAALNFQEIALGSGGEFTSQVSSSGSQLNVLLVTDEAGSVTTVPNDGNFPRAYRCAADLRN
jgi:hypothetical protein